MALNNGRDLYTRLMPPSKKQINDRAKELSIKIDENTKKTEVKIEQLLKETNKIKELNIKIDSDTKKIESQLSTLEKLLGKSATQIHDVKSELDELKKSVKELEKKVSENSRKQKEQTDILSAKLSSELRASTSNIRSDLRKIKSEVIDEVKNYMNQELTRRDIWPVRPAEIKRLSEGRPVWVIKCPAPEGDAKIRWGDYPFAMALKRELEKKGVYVLVDTHEDWGCETGADVVLALRGSYLYRPDRRNEKCLYIMWNIRHPDMVTIEEYKLYDVVCVGSYHYAKELRERISIPVIPLLQCTDTELFFPSEDTATSFEREYIFIGNSRGVARSSVMWAIEDNLPLRIWGSGWNQILKDHMELIEAPCIENSKIPELYRTSKVALNDHWSDMKDKQFINNRIFDVLACGLPVISDTCQELKELFPEAVLHYETKEEFDNCIKKVEHNYDTIRWKVKEQWPLIQKEYSFRARAIQLLEIAKQYQIKWL